MKVNDKKILFVIPAYNEELNIGKVIDEIEIDMSNCDIVVVNDCSKDNTVKIVKEKGVNCVTMPFNVKYAMAVQTGIKYAYEHDYDYVIQFDADGQHIAKEAERLLDIMKQENCDIVIGSRFLKKTDYKHSFFRKIGTKLFTLMIKLFCKQKITDPTSGFQCLNKRVITRYSKMGKYPEYPDANLIIEMLLDGYQICEVPVKMREREFGESMHGGIIKPIKYMINMFYAIIIIVIRNVGFKRRKGK
jgi:glycosyltransferase involved in cell wall biosynthesis